MKDEIVQKLLLLNQEFYAQFAAPFANSRSSPQPGFSKLLDYAPALGDGVLDIGCGNGRFGQFLVDENYSFNYTGIDFTADLLGFAEEKVNGMYLRRDISRKGYLDGLAKFDLIVCLAAMQHIPGRINRLSMLQEMGRHLAEQGRIILANWQFMDSPRQQRKIREWDMVGVDEVDVEDGDFLLSWQRDGEGLRYVCAIDAKETEDLAAAAKLEIVTQFRSDGKEGNLNLYTILAHRIG